MSQSVALGLVSFRSREQTLSCLESLAAFDGEIVVVDNDSNDGTVEAIEAAFPDVVVIANTDNVGFGAAVNQILSAVTTKYLLVMNADVRGSVDDVAALCNYLDEHDDVAIVGPQLYGSEGSLQQPFMKFPTLRSFFVDQCGARPVLRAVSRSSGREIRQAVDVSWVLGAVMLMRCDAVRAVDGFDEDYFLYFEEVDLAKRLASCGSKVAFVPEARFFHAGGGSSRTLRVFSEQHFYRSAARYFAQHGGLPARMFYRPVAIAALGSSWLAGLLRWRRNDSELFGAIIEDRQNWQTADRSESVGRADWRMLLTWESIDSVPRISVPPSHLEEWMVEDRWAAAGPPFDASLHDLSDPESGELVSSRLVLVGGRLDDVPRGFVARRYLPVPLRMPKAYLPIDEVSVVSWWLADSLVGVPQRVVRLVAIALRAVAGSRSIVIAAREEIGDEVEPLVLLTSGHDEGSRIIRIRFDAETKFPLRVEKISNRPRYEPNNVVEHQSLIDLRSIVPPAIQSSIPEAIELTRVAGASTTVESIMGGVKMSRHLGPRSRRASAAAELRRTVDWLTQLHHATVVSFTWDERAFDELLLSPLETLDRSSGSSGYLIQRLRPLIDEAFGGAETLRGATVVRHFDLGPWNVLLQKSNLGVIDWEASDPRPLDRRGLALADACYLATYWRHLVAGAKSLSDEQTLAGFGRPTRRQSWAMLTSRELVASAATEVEIAVETLRAVWVHCWLEQAVFTSIRRPSGDPGKPLQYLLWAAESSDRSRLH